MKKKILLFAICTIVLISSSACFPTGENNDVITSTGQTVSPKHIKRELGENLSVDADINVSENVKWKEYNAELKNFSEKELNVSFLNDKEISKQIESPSIYSKDKAISYEFSDNTYLSVQSGYLYYTHPQYDKGYYSVAISDRSVGNIRPDIAEVYTKSSLEGIDKEESIEQVRGILNSLEISVFNQPQAYSLDYETLMSEWVDFTLPNGMPAEPWTREDEAYVIFFTAMADNLNISDLSYSDSQKQVIVPGSQIYAIVSKNGIICLSIQGIYSINNTSDDREIISSESALEIVNTKYSNIILTDKVLISRISAELVSICENADQYKYKLVPAWVFTLSQTFTSNDIKGEHTRVVNFKVVINAITGSEMRLGGA